MNRILNCLIFGHPIDNLLIYEQLTHLLIQIHAKTYLGGREGQMVLEILRKNIMSKNDDRVDFNILGAVPY